MHYIRCGLNHREKLIKLYHSPQCEMRNRVLWLQFYYFEEKFLSLFDLVGIL